MAYPIMTTPALVVDEQVKCSGRIPSKDELRSWLSYGPEGRRRAALLAHLLFLAKGRGVMGIRRSELAHRDSVRALHRYGAGQGALAGE